MYVRAVAGDACRGPADFSSACHSARSLRNLINQSTNEQKKQKQMQGVDVHISCNHIWPALFVGREDGAENTAGSTNHHSTTDFFAFHHNVW